MRNLQKLVEQRELYAIHEEATVHELAQAFYDRNVGALPVIQGDRVVGVVSERDIVRRLLLPGKDPEATKVRDIMTREVVVGDVGDTPEGCMGTMQAAGVRHLPIVREQKLVGFISIRDLFAAEIEKKHEEVKHLTDYIYFVPPSGPARGKSGSS